MPRFQSTIAAIIVATTAVAVSITAATYAQSPAPATATLTIGSPAPKLPVAEWVKGKPVTLGDGGIHVVEFWATWCGPCKVSIPHLTAMAKKYAGKADFTGVSVWERGADVPTLVKTFVTKMGTKMDYHVARDDAKGTLAATWMTAAGQDGIPTAFLIDKTGKVVWIGHPMDGLDEAVGKVVAGTFDTASAAKGIKEKQEAKAKDAAKSAKLDELFGPALALARQKKLPEAVAAIDAVLASNAGYAGDVAPLKFRMMMSYDEVGAQSYAARAAKAELKDKPETLNQIAWGIVEPKSVVKKPDYTSAVIIAEAGVAATQGKDPMVLDTLSYAYEKAGDLDKAISTEEKAVGLFPVDAKSEDQANMIARVVTLKKLKATK